MTSFIQETSQEQVAAILSAQDSEETFDIQEQAIAHLTALGYNRGEPVYMRYIHPVTKISAKKTKLNFDELGSYQQKGYDAYFVVNPGGDCDNDITEGRAIFYEHDNMPKEEQLYLWQKLGLPEPTFQVYTGGKSIHSYWVFKTPISVELWKEIQVALIKYSKGDKKLVNPSRILRLAGSRYMKGAAPGSTRAEIISESLKKYSYEELRNIIPPQFLPKVSSPASTLPLDRTPSTLDEEVASKSQLERTPKLQIDLTPSHLDEVPLYQCLTKDDRNLIDNGTPDYRNETGAKLARNLIGTAIRLNCLKIPFSGDQWNLFQDYCRRCPSGDGWDEREWEQIWQSALKSNPTATLTDEAIENCVKSWQWNQQKRAKPPQPSDGSQPGTNAQPPTKKSSPKKTIQQARTQKGQKEQDLPKTLPAQKAEKKKPVLKKKPALQPIPENLSLVRLPAPATDGPQPISTFNARYGETKEITYSYSENQWVVGIEWKDLNKPKGRAKRFSQWHQNKKGEAINKKGDCPWKPYRIDEALNAAAASDPALALALTFVEREECVEALRAAGLASITLQEDNWGKEELQRMVETIKASPVKCLVFLKDNDDTGEKKAKEVYDACVNGGLNILIVDSLAISPQLGNKGDVADILQEMESAEFIARLEQSIHRAVQARWTEVPLEQCIKEEDRTLLHRDWGFGNNGVAGEDRPLVGARLAANLIGTAKRMSVLGIPMSGSAWLLYQGYCSVCSLEPREGWKNEDWDRAWEEGKSNPAATLSDEEIWNLAKDWQHTQESKAKPDGEVFEDEENWEAPDDSANPDIVQSKSKTKYRYSVIQLHWGNRLRLNELKNIIELDGQPLELDTIPIQLAVELDEDFSKEQAIAICTVIAKANSYNPVKDYLEDCIQKHTPTPIDIENLATRWFGISDRLSNIYLKRYLIGAVARIYQPGCQVDTSLILQGNQGFKKSTFFRVLHQGSEIRQSHETWFDDTMCDISNKDERDKLHRFWCLEWSELERVLRKGDDQVKAFLTTKADTYRPPYGREPITKLRQSVIVGTTNREEFLSDDSGDRRFWAIKIERAIDSAQIEAERDMVWASAVAAYKAGEQWHLTEEEQALSTASNSEFHTTDSWYDYVAEFVQNRPRITIAQILQTALEFDKSRHDRASQMRVASILKRLGWEKEKKRIATDGTRTHAWVPPSQPSAPPTSPPSSTPPSRLEVGQTSNDGVSTSPGSTPVQSAQPRPTSHSEVGQTSSDDVSTSPGFAAQPTQPFSQNFSQTTPTLENTLSTLNCGDEKTGQSVCSSLVGQVGQEVLNTSHSNDFGGAQPTAQPTAQPKDQDEEVGQQATEEERKDIAMLQVAETPEEVMIVLSSFVKHSESYEDRLLELVTQAEKERIEALKFEAQRQAQPGVKCWVLCSEDFVWREATLISVPQLPGTTYWRFELENEFPGIKKDQIIQTMRNSLGSSWWLIA
ncbi:virulence-associated E family protein [Trichocoleus sp. DQ-A3]|uniref:virulence-associated E family protein n=1 Tax=Cyanophyceae TaxID=3028117 RepID=UPI0016871F4E|nr:virulence-associated E family protein [Coleofasciculus sp. FACHB-125]MBD1903888.1 hypothetical protein [Coleofasciculus sp. FACHB-125]